MPTATFQISAVTLAGPISTFTVSGAPFASRQRVTGMLYQSFSGYDSCWNPSTFRYCWKYPWRYRRPTPTRGRPRSDEVFMWSPESMPRPPE